MNSKRTALTYFLLLAYPFSKTLQVNGHSFLSLGTFVSFAVLALFAGLLFLVCKVKPLSPFVLVLLLVGFIDVPVTEASTSLGLPYGGAWVVAIALSLCVFLDQKALLRLMTFLVWGAMGSEVIFLGIKEVRHLLARPTVSVADSNRQLILYIVADGHEGLGWLPTAVPEGDKREVEDFYLSNGFRLYEKAYSFYFQTKYAIPQILHNRIDLAKTIRARENPLFDQWKNKNYKIHVFQSSILNFCVRGEMECFTYSPSSTEGVPSLSPWEVAQIEFVQFVQARPHWRSLASRLPKSYLFRSFRSAVPVLSAFEKMREQLPEITGPTVFFAHLLIPHSPFMLDRECKARSVPSWDVPQWYPEVPDALKQRTLGEFYSHYFEQVGCLNNQLSTLFSDLRRFKLWEKTTIIIHGDHGSRIVRNSPTENLEAIGMDELRASYGTHLAVRFGTGNRSEIVSEAVPVSEVIHKALETGLSLSVEERKFVFGGLESTTPIPLSRFISP